ncbi:transposase [Sorangium sp. So ce1128]
MEVDRHQVLRAHTLVAVDREAERSEPLGGTFGVPVEGTGKKLASRFALRRVRLANDDGIPVEEHEPLWLLIEWPFGESEPSQFAVTTLGTKMSKKQIVRQYKERYRTEQAYEELKGELGLDHFEGRRFRGWHHHVSVVLCCYAFIVAERARSFFPSADAAARHDECGASTPDRRSNG